MRKLTVLISLLSMAAILPARAQTTIASGTLISSPATGAEEVLWVAQGCPTPNQGVSTAFFDIRPYAGAALIVSVDAAATLPATPPPSLWVRQWKSCDLIGSDAGASGSPTPGHPLSIRAIGAYLELASNSPYSVQVRYSVATS